MIALKIVMYSIQGHQPVVEHLCKSSVDVNKPNKNGCTPVYSSLIGVYLFILKIYQIACR